MEIFIGTILPFAGSYAPTGWLFCNGQQLSIQTNAALYSIIGITYGGDGKTTFNLPDLRGRFIVGSDQSTNGSTYSWGKKGGAVSNNVNVVSSGAVALTVNNLPAHTHTFTGAAATASINANADLSNVSVSVPATTDANAAGATNIPASGLVLGPAKTTNTPSANCNIYRQPSTTPANNTNILGSKLTGTAPVTGSVAVTPVGTISNTGNGTPITVATSGNANVSTMPPYMAINFIICVDGLYPPRP